MNSDDRRALNLAMAELCGYPVVQRGDPCPAGEHARERPEGIWLYTAENGIFRGGRVWSPVTNPAQALEVAEVLRKQDLYVRFTLVPDSEHRAQHYIAKIEKKDTSSRLALWDVYRLGDTLAEAICLVAAETLEEKGGGV